MGSLESGEQPTWPAMIVLRRVENVQFVLISCYLFSISYIERILDNYLEMEEFFSQYI